MLDDFEDHLFQHDQSRPQELGLEPRIEKCQEWEENSFRCAKNNFVVYIHDPS